MSNLILIGIGGFLGSVLRYWVSGYVQQLTRSVDFPYGTLVVNVLGCFTIGFLSQLVETRGLFTAQARAFVFIGLLGGFTTFSTFGNESINLLRDGENVFAAGNVATHLGLGLGAVWFGRSLAFLIWR
jgi:CrcB protein